MSQQSTGWPQVINPGGLTASSSTEDFIVGQKALDTVGNEYRYVLTADLDLTDGDVVYPASTTPFTVTKDYTGGSAVTAKVCGVAISAITTGEYGWIQVGGIHDAVKTDGGIVAGDPLIGHTVDGTADTMAAGEEHLVFGFALATDDATPVTQVLLNQL